MGTVSVISSVVGSKGEQTLLRTGSASTLLHWSLRWAGRQHGGYTLQISVVTHIDCTRQHWPCKKEKKKRNVFAQNVLHSTSSSSVGFCAFNNHLETPNLVFVVAGVEGELQEWRSSWSSSVLGGPWLGLSSSASWWLKMPTALIACIQ